MEPDEGNLEDDGLMATPRFKKSIREVLQSRGSPEQRQIGTQQAVESVQAQQNGQDEESSDELEPPPVMESLEIKTDRLTFNFDSAPSTPSSFSFADSRRKRRELIMKLEQKSEQRIPHQRTSPSPEDFSPGLFGNLSPGLFNSPSPSGEEKQLPKPEQPQFKTAWTVDHWALLNEAIEPLGLERTGDLTSLPTLPNDVMNRFPGFPPMEVKGRALALARQKRKSILVESTL